MAISTYKVFLMHGSEKLIDIKDYPALGAEPESLDTTTMSDSQETHIPGIQKADSLTFTANYDHTEFMKLKALEDKEEEYAVWFGGTVESGVLTPTGENGKFTFKGRLSVYVDGADVNSVVDMKITIVQSTPITAA